MPAEEEVHDPVSGLALLVRKAFYLLPGHDIVARYIASSYQNDPVRSLLELILFLFLVRTVLQNRTRANRLNFVSMSKKVCGRADPGH